MGPMIRKHICTVAKDNYIYFLGGCPKWYYFTRLMSVMADADRYNLSTNTWDKIADLQEARAAAFGAAAYGKIFVFGGCAAESLQLHSCEEHDETTNEWHFIASLKSPDICSSTVVCADDKVFLVSVYERHSGTVECYDPDEDEWKEKTQIPVEWMPSLRECPVTAMRVLKRNKLFQSKFLQDKEVRPAVPQSTSLRRQSSSSNILGQSMCDTI